MREMLEMLAMEILDPKIREQVTAIAVNLLGDR